MSEIEKTLEDFISDFENLVIDYCFTMGMGEIVADTPRDKAIELINNFLLTIKSVERIKWHP